MGERCRALCRRFIYPDAGMSSRTNDSYLRGRDELVVQSGRTELSLGHTERPAREEDPQAHSSLLLLRAFYSGTERTRHRGGVLGSLRFLKHRGESLLIGEGRAGGGRKQADGH